MITRSRTSNIAITLFLALLFGVPPLLVLAGSRNVERIDNRKLAAFPMPGWSSAVDAGYYKKLTEYLIDQFPFRPQIIRARGEVMEDYLSDFNNSRIVHGRGDWMFLREEIRYSCDKPEIMAQAVRGMRTFTDFAKGLGKDVVFMIAPNKATITPERVSWRFKPYLECEDRHRALFHAMVRNQGPKLTYLDAFKPTREARKTWPQGVYHWFDVHWDCRGTGILGDLILTDLNRGAPSTLPRAYEPEPRVSDISTVLGRPFEMEWMGCQSTAPESAVQRLDDAKNDYFSAFRSDAPATPRGGRVLIIHDSFANGLKRLMPPVLPGLVMYNINNRDVGQLAKAIDEADIIYVEIVERSAYASFARLGHPNFMGPLKAKMP
jgi:SGNH hydrolase-like domain, acetyltransferase AlgX